MRRGGRPSFLFKPDPPLSRLFPTILPIEKFIKDQSNPIATMPSITTIDGYTFNNWGPVTTTFTAPASCATVTDNMRIGLSSSPAFWMYANQCSTFAYYDCIPTGTAQVTTTYDANPADVLDYSYFSPGLDCPAGWNTVGVAARDQDSSLSVEGVLKPTVTTPAYPHIPQWENGPSLFVGLLDPGETAVVCCPRYVFIIRRIYTSK